MLWLLPSYLHTCCTWSPWICLFCFQFISICLCGSAYLLAAHGLLSKYCLTSKYLKVFQALSCWLLADWRCGQRASDVLPFGVSYAVRSPQRFPPGILGSVLCVCSSGFLPHPRGQQAQGVRAAPLQSLLHLVRPSCTAWSWHLLIWEDVLKGQSECIWSLFEVLPICQASSAMLTTLQYL